MHHTTLLSIAALTLAMTTLTPPARAADKADSILVYFGTYTGANSKGIYVSRLDLKSGQLSTPEVAGEVTNPSFLEIHPDGQHLYAVGEIYGPAGKKGGAVTAFSIDRATGKLTQLNQQTSGGAGPCHISIDPKGKVAMVANYGGGSVEVLPIGADGKLAEPTCFIQHEGKSVDPRRQAGPHSHSINPDAAGNYAFVCDLGLDKVLIYKLDAANGKLTPNDPPFVKVADGAGPRHFAFHPTGKYAYVINEMGLTITAFTYDATKGALAEIQTIDTLPAGAKREGASTAEVRVHPSGKFVYGSNRGHDSISLFTCDPATGKLTSAGNFPAGGKMPRNFNIDPTGQFMVVANQGGNVVVYKINPDTGALTATNSTFELGSPVCVRFLK